MLLLSLIVIVNIAAEAVTMETSEETLRAPNTAIPIGDLKIGDYFTLGKYNDEPILWRYVVDDEHGKLIVSDKILCIKPFDVEFIGLYDENRDDSHNR